MNLPAQLLLFLITGAALFIGGYLTGASDGRTGCVTTQAQAQQAGQAVADKETSRRENIGEQREASRERIRVVYIRLKEKVDENVKHNPAVNDCGLDADGLRNWNAANAGETPPVLQEPDYRLPSAASGQVWKVEGLVPQPHRGDGAVHAVPGSAEEAGGVRIRQTIGRAPG
jgi:hypothetical protein